MRRDAFSRAAFEDAEGIEHYPRPALEHGFDDPERPQEITVFDDETTGDSGVMTNWLTFAPAAAAVPMEEWR